MTEMKIAQNWKEVGELEEKYDVLAGATTLQAEQTLRGKYPISWLRLLELKVQEMQQLLGEAKTLSAQAAPDNLYQLQLKVNALRKITIEMDDGLLVFSRELMQPEAHA
ncbi:MAG: hypothetical protein DRI77_09905 [Chloroflexi bacterium]|nr:MAG: hypothetical protein DRI77_09905 [Chloroflexota bacterium]